MKTFREFITEVYDPDVVGKAQIRKQGEGGRVGRMRKQSEPEKRRMKAVGGGKMVPAKTYKDRKDIGTQRKTSDRQQQPTQERGSAREKQMAAARAERKRAAQKRAAAKAGKVTVLPSQATSKPKPKTKALKKQADKLLATKKKKTADPNYKPQKASGYTRDERHRLRNAARALMRDMKKGKEKPASAYDPQIKNFGKQTGSSAYSNTGIVKKGRKVGS